MGKICVLYWITPFHSNYIVHYYEEIRIRWIHIESE